MPSGYSSLGWISGCLRRIVENAVAGVYKLLSTSASHPLYYEVAITACDVLQVADHYFVFLYLTAPQGAVKMASQKMEVQKNPKLGNELQRALGAWLHSQQKKRVRETYYCSWA